MANVSISNRGSGLFSPLLSTARVVDCYRASNYWEEQGWKLEGYRLRGYYRTYRGSFRGMIKLFDSGEHQFFIYSPPNQIRYHSHWVCFMYRGTGWYWVHFAVEPANVDAGILSVEKIIREAMELHV